MPNTLPALHLHLPSSGLRIRAGKIRKKDEPFFELLFVGRRDGWWDIESAAAESASFDLASRLDSMVHSIMVSGPWPETTSEVELAVDETVLEQLLAGASESRGKHILIGCKTRILPPRTKHLHMVRLALTSLSLHDTNDDVQRRLSEKASRGEAVWTLAPSPSADQLLGQPGSEHFKNPLDPDILAAFAHYGVRIGASGGYWTIDREDGSSIDMWHGADGFCVTYNGIREGVLDQFLAIPDEDLYFVVDNLVAGKRSTVCSRFPSQPDVTLGETLLAA